MSETLLVTGGAGFIGSHFIRLVLSRTDWHVVNLDKLTYAGDLARLADVADDPRYRLIVGDVADPDVVQDLFQREAPRAVVNFAAESHVDRSILDAAPFLQTNVLGVQVLLDAARARGVDRFLQISTDEVYGDADTHGPFREEDRLAPSSPYAASKAAADVLCLAYARTHGLPVVIVRSSNNYGPYQFPEKLIPLLIRNALDGRELPLYGDGAQRRDWLFVEDNAEAILVALERGVAGTVYNVATGVEHTNLEVAHALCAGLAGDAGLDEAALRARVRFVPDRPGHDRRYAVDTTRSRRELEWSESVDFAVGLQQTVRWYLAHQAWTRGVTSRDYETYYDAVYKKSWGRA